MQGEVANEKVDLQPPLRSFHVFCSEHNLGAVELVGELAFELSVQLNEPRASMTSWTFNKQSLFMTTNLDDLARCDHILVCPWTPQTS